MSYGYEDSLHPEKIYDKDPSPLTRDAPAPVKGSSLGNGVNLQPSYYNGGDVDLGWPLMKLKAHAKIKTVRIEIEPDQVKNAVRWIKEAIGFGYSVIATYHKYTVLGTDSDAELQAAANWWKTNYNILKASGSFTINLMNEWGSHEITPGNYATSYNKAIVTLRSFYSGPIIIDIPGWGQETSTAKEAIKGSNSTKIDDANIILSAHIYPSAYNHKRKRWLSKTDLDELASSGKKCIVGEFGNVGKGSADWSALVDHAKSIQWPVLGWAWNGDGGPMNMIAPQFQPNTPGKPKVYQKSAYFETIYNKL